MDNAHGIEFNVMSPDTFYEKVATAPIGHWIEYYRGLIGRDRSKEAGKPGWERIDALADEVYRLYERGKGTIIHRRHAKGDHSYYFVKLR